MPKASVDMKISDRAQERVLLEEELLEGHQKFWVNAHTGEVMRLSQSPPRPDHDMFLVLNAEHMGVDLSDIDPVQLGLILQRRSRLASTSSHITVAAGRAGWVRVHRNTKTKEVNIDSLNEGDALLAARMAVVGMRAPRTLSLDLFGGVNGDERKQNLILRGSEISLFLDDGLFPDGTHVSCSPSDSQHDNVQCDAVSIPMSPR